MKNIRKVLILFIIVISYNNLFSEILDKIIARVGREIILESDLKNQMIQMKGSGMLTPNITNLDVLNQMIESKLIVQKAKDEEFVVDEIKIKSLADKQIKSMIEKYPSESDFRKELQKSNLNMFELRKFYEKGLTEQRLKDQIIQKEIKSKIHITEAEIEEYYDEKIDSFPLRPEMDKLGMINRSIKASKETKKKIFLEITDIMNKVISGKDFSKLAQEFSDCSSSKVGGDLGFFGKGQMVKPFEDAAFSLRPGEISEIVETQFGYHIIKMEEKNDDGEIRVRHILKMVVPSEIDIKAELQLMDNIREKLIAGEDFAEIAKTYSEDDSSAVIGGVIGEYEKDDYPEMFKSYIEPLNYKEYSQVIREQDLLYIFTKIEKIPERKYIYSEIENKLREIVTNEKQIDLYEKWMKDLMKEKYVEILIDE